MSQTSFDMLTIAMKVLPAGRMSTRDDLSIKTKLMGVLHVSSNIFQQTPISLVFIDQLSSPRRSALQDDPIDFFNIILLLEIDGDHLDSASGVRDRSPKLVSITSIHVSFSPVRIDGD